MDEKPAPEMYELFFVFQPISDDDGTAWNDLKSWIVESRDVLDISNPPPEVLRLYAGFYLNFPDLFPTKEQRLQGINGLDGLYLGPVCESVSTFCIPMDHAEGIVRFALDTSRHLGVTVFDPISEHIHRTDGFDKMEMTFEGEALFVSPNLKQICNAVDVMTPEGGPSFIILNGDGLNYAQAAGGDGQYTCEWREYTGEVFKHWVAGTSAKGRRNVKIRTNGFHLVVKSNENLRAAEVKSILAAFARNESRPQNWVWRDITDEFQ